MNLFLVTPEEIKADRTVTVSGRRAEHIFCVLHAKEGHVLRAGVLGGGLGQAVVLASSRKEAVLQLDDLSQPPLPDRGIIPVIALPRPQSFKKTLHFIASAGIRTAYFIHSAKVEKSYWNSDAVKPEAVREELLLGLEQGGCTVLPDIRFRPSFRQFLASDELKELKQNRVALIAHPRNAVPCPSQMTEQSVIVIGPEGGFQDNEVTAFTDAGFLPVEIGPYILRVEFALSCLCGRLLT